MSEGRPVRSSPKRLHHRLIIMTQTHQTLLILKIDIHLNISLSGKNVERFL